MLILWSCVESVDGRSQEVFSEHSREEVGTGFAVSRYALPNRRKKIRFENMRRTAPPLTSSYVYSEDGRVLRSIYEEFPPNRRTGIARSTVHSFSLFVLPTRFPSDTTYTRTGDSVSVELGGSAHLRFGRREDGRFETQGVGEPASLVDPSFFVATDETAFQIIVGDERLGYMNPRATSKIQYLGSNCDRIPNDRLFDYELTSRGSVDSVSRKSIADILDAIRDLCRGSLVIPDDMRIQMLEAAGENARDSEGAYLIPPSALASPAAQVAR